MAGDIFRKVNIWSGGGFFELLLFWFSEYDRMAIKIYKVVKNLAIHLEANLRAGSFIGKVL